MKSINRIIEDCIIAIDNEYDEIGSVNKVINDANNGYFVDFMARVEMLAQLSKGWNKVHGRDSVYHEEYLHDIVNQYSNEFTETPLIECISSVNDAIADYLHFVYCAGIGDNLDDTALYIKLIGKQCNYGGGGDSYAI